MPCRTTIAKTLGDCIWLSCEVKTPELETSNDCQWNDDYWRDGWQSDFNRGWRMDWCLGPAYASQRWYDDTSVSGFQARVQNGDKCWTLSVVPKLMFRWSIRIPLRLLKNVVSTMVTKTLKCRVCVCVEAWRSKTGGPILRWPQNNLNKRTRKMI